MAGTNSSSEIVVFDDPELNPGLERRANSALLKLLSGERSNSDFTFFPGEQNKRLLRVFATYDSHSFAEHVIKINLELAMRFFHELWARGITEAIEGNEYLPGLINSCKQFGIDLVYLFREESYDVGHLFEVHNVPTEEREAFFDYLRALGLLVAGDNPAQ